MSEAMNRARKIVKDFEDQFGDLTATEGDWLARRIAESIQDWANKLRDIVKGQ